MRKPAAYPSQNTLRVRSRPYKGNPKYPTLRKRRSGWGTRKGTQAEACATQIRRARKVPLSRRMTLDRIILTGENDARIYSGDYCDDRGDCGRGAFGCGHGAHHDARGYSAHGHGEIPGDAGHGRECGTQRAENRKPDSADGTESGGWRGDLRVQVRDVPWRSGPSPIATR